MAGAKLNWTNFKADCLAKSMTMQWKQVKNVYWLIATDGPYSYECVIRIESPAGADQLDFETNYKNAVTVNKKVGVQIDTETSQLVRLKYAPVGWHYHAHGIEIKTATIGGIYSKKPDGTDTGFCTVKFYRVDGTEITSGLQADLDAECVKTLVQWEANHSSEIVCGMLRNATALTDDVRLDVIAAPHIPSAYGGYKVFVQNLNLKFIEAKWDLKTDGRASKHIVYDPVNFSHRFHIQFKHPVGSKTEHILVFEIYKA